MFQVLLSSSDDFPTITHTHPPDKLTVTIDRSKIPRHGKPVIARLMLQLHIWRSTADVEACRAYYEELTTPTGQFLEWRRIMLAKQAARHVFVQPNTFLSGGEVVLKEYEGSVEGMVQRWAERVLGMDGRGNELLCR